MTFRLQAGDNHISGEGPRIGVTRLGLDKPALNEVLGALIVGGNQVVDGALKHEVVGTYAEFSLGDPLTEKSEARLRGLGFSGLSGALL
jgi:hypothetical protein